MIKLFTHTDLDGIGCAILMKNIRPLADIEYCECSEINQKVKEYINNKEYEYYAVTYITDLSVNEELAEIIDNLKIKIILLDHHQTALWLNKYEWAHVCIMDYELQEETCGTYLLYSMLYGEDRKECPQIKYLANIIRLYDTWIWNKRNFNIPKQINDLFMILGKDKFIDKCLAFIKNEDRYFLTDDDMAILEIREEEKQRYIDKKNKTLIKFKLLDYNAGVVFAENYHSELGNRLCELNPDIDLAIIINFDYGVSYRSIKESVDVSKIAKVFGGGGHKLASGSPIPNNLKEEILSNIFNK